MSPRARFCPECGHGAAPAAAAAIPGSAVAKLPWIIAGVALLAVMATVIAIVSRRPAPAGAAPFAQGSDPSGQATTDISQMPIRSQAERLFDRVMRASEQGDTGQVQFFGPMALQAYGMVAADASDSLSLDDRLHVGMLALATGDPAVAAAQGDSIARAGRTHLFGTVLHARAAEMQNQAATVRQQWGRFLDAYDAERGKNLDEYTQHDVMLVQARDAAKRLLNR
jgi:hypothetical protein